MNKPGALIIEGHVQGLSNTRSLGEADIPVYVVDKTDCIARYSKYCKKFFRCPDFIKDEFADFLIELAKNEGIKDWVLIPSNDHAVYTISKHKTRLEQLFKVITPALDIIDNIYDKLSLIEIAKKNNMPVPVTQNFQSVDEEISKDLRFPVLTKGRNGLSFYKTVGKKAFLANDEVELQSQLQIISLKLSLENTFTQELIPFYGNNRTISFTAFCEQGEIKTHWAGIKIREHPFQFGTATLAKSIELKECYDLSIPLLKELNYTGVCEVEYLLDPRDNQYKLIEINARTWLWVELAKACGVNYALMIYNYLNNIPTVYPNDISIEKKWINFLTDTVFAISSIVKGRLKLIDYLRSLNLNTVKAVFSWHDLLPGIIYPFMIFAIARRRR